VDDAVPDRYGDIGSQTAPVKPALASLKAGQPGLEPGIAGFGDLACLEQVALESQKGEKYTHGNVEGNEAIRSYSVEDDDLAADTHRPLYPSIGRQEHRAEGLGERDIGGIVGAEVVAQLPYPGEQRQVWDAPKGKCREIGESLSGSALVKPFGPSGATQGRDDLKVDQLRRHELLAAQMLTGTIAVGVVVG
jgi:hypothetical protein